MDFKEFNKDKYSYNMILMFINWLKKDLVLIPYYKIINTYRITQLYIQ